MIAPPWSHRAGRELVDDEGASNVDALDAVEGLQLHLGDGGEWHDARCVDDDVDAAEVLSCGLEEGGHRRLVGDIAADGDGAAQSDSDLAAAVSERYTRPRRTLAVDYFRKAAERGQLRADVDLQLLVDQLWGACYNRLLVPDAPLDEEFAVALVTNTLYGAASADYRGRA